MKHKLILFFLLLFASTPIFSQFLDGTFILSPKVNHATVIDIPEARFYNGNKLQVWEYYSASSNQHFKIKKIRQGVVQFVTNFNWDISFDVPDGRMVNGNQVQIWKLYPNPIQYWNLEKVEGAYYIIRSNIDPNYVLTVGGHGGNGSKVFISRYTRSENQIWAITQVGSTSYNIFKQLFDKSTKK